MQNTQFKAFEVRRANERGVADHGWLKSQHTFSFASYQDPDQSGFSDLLVINDDRVAPGGGFGTHGHRDMEIFSYALEGAIEHKDSMGTGSVIRPGDVQLMSAGKGVFHSEFNHSQEALVHFLQIWIVPNRVGLAPRYQQAHFAAEEKRGKLRLVISPTSEAGSLHIQQDASVYAGLLDGSERFVHRVQPERNAYVHVARGSLVLNGVTLEEGDGVRIRGESKLEFSGGKNAEVLVFDLRAKERPEMPR